MINKIGPNCNSVKKQTIFKGFESKIPVKYLDSAPLKNATETLKTEFAENKFVHILLKSEEKNNKGAKFFAYILPTKKGLQMLNAKSIKKDNVTQRAAVEASGDFDAFVKSVKEGAAKVENFITNPKVQGKVNVE